MMLFYRTAFCIFLASLLFNLQADQGNVKVTFQPPQGWVMADQSMLSPNVKVLIVGPQKGAMPPSLNLATETYAGTLKEYVATMKKISQKANVQWKDLGPFKTLAGRANLSQVLSKTEWGDVQMFHVVFLKEGTIYILAAAALKEEFPSLSKQFHAALTSLQISAPYACY